VKLPLCELSNNQTNKTSILLQFHETRHSWQLLQNGESLLQLARNMNN